MESAQRRWYPLMDLAKEDWPKMELYTLKNRVGKLSKTSLGGPREREGIYPRKNILQHGGYKGAFHALENLLGGTLLYLNTSGAF